MDVYYSADLYDAAFLLVQGAQFKRVKEYYKNHSGKSFSVLELTGVTFEMLQRLYDGGSSVNYQKFKEKRQYIKQKVGKHAQKNTYTEINSTEIYKIHKELGKQFTQMKEFYKGSGPKRVVEEYAETNNS